MSTIVNTTMVLKVTLSCRVFLIVDEYLY